MDPEDPIFQARVRRSLEQARAENPSAAALMDQEGPDRYGPGTIAILRRYGELLFLELGFIPVPDSNRADDDTRRDR